MRCGVRGRRLCRDAPDLEGALVLFEEEFEGAKTIYGASHEETRASERNLATLRRAARSPGHGAT